jgi:hypothetical protein
VEAAAVHVQAFDDRDARKRTALDDPPTHGSECGVCAVDCQPFSDASALAAVRSQPTFADAGWASSFAGPVPVRLYSDGPRAPWVSPAVLVEAKPCHMPGRFCQRGLGRLALFQNTRLFRISNGGADVADAFKNELQDSGIIRDASRPLGVSCCLRSKAGGGRLRVIEVSNVAFLPRKLVICPTSSPKQRK